MLEARYPEFSATIERLVRHLLEHWAKSNGSFRSRKLIIGYDNVPMHRWGQSELFRSLCLFLAKSKGYEPIPIMNSANHVRNLRNL